MSVFQSVAFLPVLPPYYLNSQGLNKLLRTLDLSQHTQPEVSPPHGRPMKTSQPTRAGSHPTMLRRLCALPQLVQTYGAPLRLRLDALGALHSSMPLRLA